MLRLAQFIHTIPPPVDDCPVLPNICNYVAYKLTVSQYIEETGAEPDMITLFIYIK